MGSPLGATCCGGPIQIDKMDTAAFVYGPTKATAHDFQQGSRAILPGESSAGVEVNEKHGHLQMPLHRMLVEMRVTLRIGTGGGRGYECAT